MDPKPLQPFEASCDHCHQQRPLFLYEPDHNCHLVPVACRWCDREKQPLLCVRCWGKERELEENTPGTDDEVALTSFFQAVSAQSRRHDAQTEADRAACEGIAAATEESAS